MIDKLREQISTAVALGDCDTIAALLHEICEVCQPDGISLSDQYLDSLETLLRSNRFRQLVGSWKVLMNLYSLEWSLVSDLQRQRLISMLMESFGEFSDNMTDGVIAKLLGQEVCGRDGFNALSQLRGHRSVQARLNVVDGLVTLAKLQLDDELRRKVIGAIRELGEDPSEAVRDSAVSGLLEATGDGQM